MKLVHSHTSIKLYEQCPLQYYRVRIVRDVKAEQTEKSLHGDRVHKSLEQRLIGGPSTPLPPETASLEPVIKAIERVKDRKKSAEQMLTLNDHLKPTTWNAPDAWIRAKIDVLALGDTDASIIDWKTGKRKYINYDQLELNSLVVFSTYPAIESIKAAYVWIGINKTDSKEYHRVNMNSMWGEYIARIRRIYKSIENNNWPARPGPLCKFCPARSTCDYAD